MKDILLNNFLKISSIPRESGHEEKIADFFVEIAKKNDLYYFKDEYNNVLIKKRGNKLGNSIALQAHLDMVCVNKENSLHDFQKDGIEVIIDGDKVTAKDTSLGADQGVGLAMMLTIMEDKLLKHPDLEFVFTVQEETTFKGAVTFPYSKLQSKCMINLDNDRDDSVFIGADGDICSEHTLIGNKIENINSNYKIKISGFAGGNSGNNIEESKNNAITTMAKILEGREVLIESINGGDNENDIATSCEVIINTQEDVYQMFEEQKVEITKIDSKISFDKENSNKIIKQILDLRSGFITKNNASANLGKIRTIDNKVIIDYIFRSIEQEELDEIYKKLTKLNNGFTIKQIYSDPIWKVNNESKLLNTFRNIYFAEYKEYPINRICKGSIECASIKKRIDDLDIISIGSNIQKNHTIEETTYISSWIKTYKCLIKVLEESDLYT